MSEVGLEEVTEIEEAPVMHDVVPTEGTVKWFDPVKGYGFIVPDGGEQDVLVHQTTLRRGGHETLYSGARIKYTTVERPQGFQADNIIAIDNTDAELPFRRQRTESFLADVEDVGDWERGVVKWFNQMRGFGFINVTDGEDDIFVHMEVLHNAQLDNLMPGQYVMLRYGVGNKGLMATEITRIDGAQELSSHDEYDDVSDYDAEY